MAQLRLGMFGALQVTLSDGSAARFESDKARALLAYLAVEADRPHRRDALTGLLWPEESEQAARHNLRQALFSLRQTLGDAAAQPPYLRITRDEIQFNPASDHALDVAAFTAQLAACERHAHARVDACAVCAPRLQQAIDLYRGKFLAEFFLADSAEFEEWTLARREALHQRALEALGNLAGYYEQLGDLDATRRCALRQLELDPWREQAHRQLMRVLAREGQRGAAIAQYETCRRVLAEGLGVDPSSETRELYDALLAGDPLPGAGSGQALPAGAAHGPLPLANLPTQLTPFIGRERELADLGRLIADPAGRCISLVGPGGMGKTRLALQAALNQRNTFAHGIAFVPLATVDTVEDIVPAIADALGFSFCCPTSPRVQLADYLRDRHMLLILDNIEQLLGAAPGQAHAADVFVELLQHAAQVKLLLTSREPLNVQGEWVFEVGGLQLPADDRADTIDASAAAALFLQRAQRARVGFALGSDERSSLARLCRLVSGSPLALELAATWVRTLSVSEIVNEIERDLDFLSASARDLPERHRSMRAVFDHSWEMLAAEEQRVLRDLSTFHGRFQRQAAEQIARASLATLSALVAKSLVHRTATGHYELHELVRQYAASRPVPEAPAPGVAERHSRYYLDWLGRCAPRLQDRHQKEAAAELAAEVDNLRAAWTWAITHDGTAQAYHVSATLLYLFELRTWFAEGEALFRNAAEIIQARAAEIQPADFALLAAHAMRAHAAYFGVRLGKSTEAYAELVPNAGHLRASGDPFAASYALWYLGMVCWAVGKFAEANDSLQAGVDKARACGARWYETMDVEYLGIVAHDMGNYAQARGYFADALARARQMGDPMVISHVLGYLSLTTLALGEIAETEKLLRDSLALAQEIGYRSGIGNALDRLGLLAQMASPDEAHRLFTASCNVFRENGDLRNVSRVLNHQGYNAFAQGDVAGAQDSFMTALPIACAGGYMPFALDALAGLAMLRAKNADAEPALELVVHVLRHPAAPRDVQARAAALRAELELRLTPQQRQAALERSQQRTFDQVVARILGQLA